MGKNLTDINTTKNTYIINSELKDILMHISDSLLISPYKKDSISNFTEVNQSACDTYGYTKEEFLKIDYSAINSFKDSNNKEICSFKEELIKNKSITSCCIHKTKSGNSFPVELHSTIGSINDTLYIITIAKSLCVEQQNTSHKNARLELNDQLLKTRNLKEAMALSISCAIKLSSMDMGCIYLIDNKTGNIKLEAQENLPESYLNKYSSFHAGTAQARSVKKGETIISQYNKLSLPIDSDDEKVMKCASMFPIEYNNKIVACIFLVSKTKLEIKDYNLCSLRLILGSIGNTILRIQAVNKFQESERAIYSLYSSIPGIAFRCKNDSVFTIESLNDAIDNITGYCKEELINNKEISFLSIIHPEDRNKVINAKKQEYAFNQHHKITYRIVTKSNQTIWVIEKGIAVKDNKGKTTHYEGYIYDITNTKLNEEEIQFSKEQLKLKQNLSNYFINYRNSAIFTKILNLTKDSLLCKSGMIGYLDKSNNIITPATCFHNKNIVTPKDLTIYKHQWTGVFGKALKTKSSIFSNSFFYTPINNVCLERFIVSPILYNKKLIGVIALGDKNSDFTTKDLESLDSITNYLSPILNSWLEERYFQKQLIDAKNKAEEADRLKSNFLATMSHELRTPLNAIIGFSEIIDKDTKLNDILDYTKTIHESGNNLLAIIEDIFELALLESKTINLRNENIEIHQICNQNAIFAEHLLQEVGKNTDIILRYKFDHRLLKKTIFSDKFKINQVLSNLIKNAIKFTHSGVIEIGCFTKDNITLTFYVKDSGIGISPKGQSVIFDLFRQIDDSNTRNYEGIGIGLTISNLIAEAMNGSLIIESEIGKGSVFNFTIPFNANNISNELSFHKSKFITNPNLN